MSMKFQEINRTVEANEVRSTYTVGNLTVHLTSRFNNKINLEDAIYQIVLHQLRSKNKLEREQVESGNVNKNVL